MMDAADPESDAAGVNEFLLRVRELGDKRDREDEERTRKLEEEILAGREARKAKRAERARSLSPQKETPTGTPVSIKSVIIPPKVEETSIPAPKESEQESQDDARNNAMGRLMGESTTPTPSAEKQQKEEAPSTSTPIRRPFGAPGGKPLSWQRRPQSMAFGDRSGFTTPTSFSRSSTVTDETNSKQDEEVSREDIAKNLAAKDPAFFRQTAERGATSAALRRDAEDSFSPSPKMALPGMSSHVPTPEPSKPLTPRPAEFTPSLGPRKLEPAFKHTPSTTPSLASTKTPTNLFDTSVRLDPTPSRSSYYGSEDEEAPPAVVASPSQGRTSPERNFRAPSPTKGLGGFVMSAGLKRGDSVRKTPGAPLGGLSRAGSTASERDWKPPVKKEHVPSRFSRESTPVMDDREETENRGRSAMSPGNQSTVSMNSFKSDDEELSVTDRETLPISPSKTFNTRRWSPTKSSWLETALLKDSGNSSSTPSQAFFSSGNGLNRSPTRENSFKRGEISPTRDNSVRREERARARQSAQNVFRKMSVDTKEQPDPIFLLDEKKVEKPELQPKPAKLSPNPLAKSTPSLTPSASAPDLTEPMGLPSDENAEARHPSPERPPSMTKSVSDMSLIEKPPVNTANKPVFERGMPGSSFEDPRALRDGLRAAQGPSGRPPPFLGARAGLKRTTTQKFEVPDELKETILAGKSNLAAAKTQNYKAPDELKETILAGKSNLAAAKTQNYKAPDELKETILAGKSSLAAKGGPMKEKAPDPVKEKIQTLRGTLRQAASNTSLSATSKTINAKPFVPAKPSLAKVFEPPEESKPSGLYRPSSPVKQPGARDGLASPDNGRSTPVKQTSAPGRIEKPGGKLADRFNPNLVGLLAKGPPAVSTGGGIVGRSLSASPIKENASEPGPQLTHMTKARARGPKRRAPAATTTAAPAKSPSPPLSSAAFSAIRAKPLVVSPKTKPLQAAAPSPKTNGGFKREVSGQMKATPPTTPNKPANFSMKATVEDGTPERNPSEKIKPPTPAKSPLLGSKSSRLSLNETARTADDEISSPPPPAPAHNPQFSFVEQPISPSPRPLFSPPISHDTPIIPRRLPTPPSTSRFTESSRENQRPLPMPPLRPRQLEVEDAQEDEMPVSVKQSAAKWGSTNSTPDTTPRRKGPIRLPSYQDEVAAMERSKSALSAVSPSQHTYDGTNSPKQTRQSANKNGVSSAYDTQTGVITGDPEAFLNEFFTGPTGPAPQFNVDVQRMLSHKPQDSTEKVVTLKKTMWEITGINGKKDPVPQGQEHVLYEDGLYMCLHAFMETSGMMASEVFLWSGDRVSHGTVEEAQLSARRLARENDGRLIVLQQGRELPSFISAIGGTLITRKGSRARLNSNDPYMLCCRRVLGGIALDEVDLHHANLCAGFPYIVSTPEKLYLWKGRGSSPEEISAARLTAFDLALDGEVKEIADGKETQYFLDMIGGDPEEQAHADYWKLKPQYSQYSARCFLVDHTSPAKIHELHPFTQSDLSPSHIYIIDAFFELYIVLGSSSQARRTDFQHALQFTQEYSILAASIEDRPFVPVCTVILGGAPREFKALFRRWEDEKMVTEWALGRRPSLRVMVGLQRAMELMGV